MDYYEVALTHDASIETEIINDLLAAELATLGFDSFISEENRLLAYIRVVDYDESALKNRLNHFPLEGIRFCHTKQLIASRNWNEEWEKNYFRPIQIGRECLIRASFHPEQAGFDYQILIDPKMSFGTGNHATTHLMLCALLRTAVDDKTFLDMGCGTAVLAILAAQKQAARIVAIDIDEWAYNNAIENCNLNNTPQVEIALGGAEQLSRFGTFDYIFANINRNVLLNDLPLYAKVLNRHGTLFMSGFYKGDIPVMEEKCREYGLQMLSFEEKDSWVAIEVKHC